MEKMPLISVIVPVYKVEAYLDKCVSSIVGQTYKNLEIILVDDGSPDNCPAKCDDWAKRDSRVSVIHKANGGLSDARNAGMAIATGELIGFVDSDDWISPNMYQLLYDHMLADDSDIVACGVEMIWEDDTHSKMLTNPGHCILNTEEAMRAIVEESWLKQPVWYKLYKTVLIQDIPFPVGKYHEDVFWSYRAVARARKVSVFDTPCYHYSQRAGSIMGAKYSIKRLDALEGKEQRNSFIHNRFPELAAESEADLLFSCLYIMQMCEQYMCADELAIAKIRVKGVVDAIRPVHRPQGMSLKASIWLYMAQLSFECSYKLRNILKIGL